MVEGEGFEHYADMIAVETDEAIMPLVGMRIMKVMRADGNEEIRFKLAGHDTAHNIMGLLEFAKQLLFLDSMTKDRDD